MAQIRITAERRNYDVKDLDCIGRECLNLHRIQVRGATNSGSAFTGRFTYECGRRAYHGCPKPLPTYSVELSRSRRKTMKNVKR